MSAIATIAGAVAPKIIDVIEKGVADKDKVNELSYEFASVAATVINAEAQGESWLQRNWRPIVMLVLVALIGAYWMGLTPAYISSVAVNEMFALVQIGLGGYVVGRSGEKIAKTFAPVISAWKPK